MKEVAKKRFKKLIGQYAYHIREAVKLDHTLKDKAIPYMINNDLIDEEVERLINNFNNLKSLLKELLDNELIQEIILNFNGEIEEINHLKE